MREVIGEAPEADDDARPGELRVPFIFVPHGEDRRLQFDLADGLEQMMARTQGTAALRAIVISRA